MGLEVESKNEIVDTIRPTEKLGKEFKQIIAEFAYGLLQKEEEKSKENAERYIKSEYITNAMNKLYMFELMNIRRSETSAPANEHELYEDFLCSNIPDWVKQHWGVEWTKGLDIHYDEPLLVIDKEKRQYTLMDSVEEIAQAFEGNAGVIERKAFDCIKDFRQEGYALCRKFIIEHSIVDSIRLEELRKALTKIGVSEKQYNDFKEKVYEAIPVNCVKECSYCGWTVSEDARHRLHCLNQKCWIETNDFSDCRELTGKHRKMRVKRDIQRFFVLPGKLELAIADFANDNGVANELWPEMDAYDIKLSFTDGEVWMIDAKAWQNAVQLKENVKENPPFPPNDLENNPSRKAYLVIPDEIMRSHKDYEIEVEKGLAGAKLSMVKCISFYELKRHIRSKLEEIKNA